jgi:hypothetical protein
VGKCQSCSAPTDLFLCHRHVTELRTLLDELPWWLDRLGEAAVGHVKLSDGGGGRNTARREPFKGEDGVLPICVCGHIDHLGRKCYDTQICGCDDYQPAVDHDKLRTQFLAAGGVNEKASDLLAKVRNTITSWQRDLCDLRRADWVTFIESYPNEPAGFVGPLLPGWRRGAPTPFIGPLLPGQFRRYTYPGVADACHWLAWNVHTIATNDWAFQCLSEFQAHMVAIERAINRPPTTRYLGRCPTWVEHTGTVCGTELRCREGTIEVTCRVCHQTHNADRLQLLMMNDLEREKMTVERILELNRVLPEEYRIPERTLRRWRKPGPNGEPPKLKARGYRRNRHTGEEEPIYLWSDVRKLRAEKPERKAVAVR